MIMRTHCPSILDLILLSEKSGLTKHPSLQQNNSGVTPWGAPWGAFWQRVYALSLACVQQPYQAFCARACSCLVKRRQITGPKQSCYSAPIPPQTQPSTQISHARQAKGVLLHITCGLDVATGCSGPELEAKESLWLASCVAWLNSNF